MNPYDWRPSALSEQRNIRQTYSFQAEWLIRGVSLYRPIKAMHARTEVTMLKHETHDRLHCKTKCWKTHNAPFESLFTATVHQGTSVGLRFLMSLLLICQ